MAGNLISFNLIKDFWTFVVKRNSILSDIDFASGHNDSRNIVMKLWIIEIDHSEAEILSRNN